MFLLRHASIMMQCRKYRDYGKIEVGNIWRQLHENNKAILKCVMGRWVEGYRKKQRRRILVA